MADGDDLVIGSLNRGVRETYLVGGTFSVGVFHESRGDTAISCFCEGPYGVFAIANNGDPAIGVSGLAPEIGVFGGFPPVWGGKPANEGVHGEGVTGVYGGGVTNGVIGTAAEGVGVSGTGSFGVHGSSRDEIYGVGVRGEAPGYEGVGVQGIAGERGIALSGTTVGDGGIGVYGFGGKGGTAGFFQGTLYVDGPLYVRGAKSAVVPHPDGSHRQLYCVESPESWFEDFGVGRLVRGKGKVKLERHFAALVRKGEYHVFLTPRGDSNGLYVSRQHSEGFEVQEQQGGKSSLTFSYRVVAKRKDVKGQRLKKVRMPAPPKSAAGKPPREPARVELKNLPDSRRVLKRQDGKPGGTSTRSSRSRRRSSN